MAIHNINIDQNQDTDVDITDANCLDEDKIIMGFYQNDINIFNLATENMGGRSGEIVIDEGVKYTAAVTDKLALLLNPADTLTHKIWKFDAADTPTELHTGSVTNEPLSGSSPSQSSLQYSNDRMYHRTIIAAETLRHTDQVVICITAVGFEITLPDAATIPGKEFHIVNQGSYAVTFNINDGTVTLDQGESAWIRARGTNGTTAIDYLVLYTDGALA